MTQRPTVLVVEDDLDNRSTLGETLEIEGFTTVLAADADEALEFLRTGTRPDVILVDLLMPGVNGLTFVDQVRNDPALATTPVVLMTGASLNANEWIPRIDAFLAKPFDVEALVGVLRDLAHASVGVLVGLACVA